MKPLVALLSNKCPRCNKGKVFENSIFNLFKIGKMKDNCSHCNLTYEKEPGFFFGAMYVSYALNVAESVIVFIISRFIANLDWFSSLGLTAFMLLVLFGVNFKLSRMIWLYMFLSKK